MPRPPGLMEPRRRSFAWLWKTLLALFVLGLFASAAYGVREYLMTSPQYRVRQVIVKTRSLDADRLRDYLHVESGTPIFGIDLEALRGKLMSMSTIASVRVTRRIPDTIVIEIEERDPVARLGRSNLMVDDTGTVFVLPNGSLLLPIFTGYQRFGVGTPPADGDHVSGMMLAAIDLLHFSGEGDGRIPITDIDLSNEDYLLCTLSDQRQARIAWEGMTSRTAESRKCLKERVYSLIQAMNDPSSSGHSLFDASIDPNRVHRLH